MATKRKGCFFLPLFVTQTNLAPGVFNPIKPIKRMCSFLSSNHVHYLYERSLLFISRNIVDVSKNGNTYIMENDAVLKPVTNWYENNNSRISSGEEVSNLWQRITWETVSIK